MVDPIDEALPDEKRKEIFYFFLKDFFSHMKNVSANIKSVSQAIRSYGYFAAVRAKIIYGIFAYSWNKQVTAVNFVFLLFYFLAIGHLKISK